MLSYRFHPCDYIAFSAGSIDFSFFLIEYHYNCHHLSNYCCNFSRYSIFLVVLILVSFFVKVLVFVVNFCQDNNCTIGEKLFLFKLCRRKIFSSRYGMIVLLIIIVSLLLFLFFIITTVKIILTDALGDIRNVTCALLKKKDY